MKITIGIPYYKAPSSLYRLIFCLNNQKTKSFNLKKEVEIIIVNDDSDTIVEESYFMAKNINLKIINKINEGPAVARNIVVKLTQGEFVFFLDVDCCPTENWLETMYSCFINNNNIDAVGGKVIARPKKGIINEYYNIANRLGKPIIDRETGEIVTIITANCGFRTESILAIGGFDESIFYKSKPGGEDLDLTYRLKQKGFKLRYEEEAIVLHEYPAKFLTIFEKNKNYGLGMARYCIARKIDPKSIRQPGFNLFSFIIYNLNFFNKIKKSYLFFRKKVGIFKSIIFSFFDIIKYFAHSYGMFILKKSSSISP